jgi:23S rRNA (guanosine2251-2'-O)-methyltransferase
MSQSEKVYGVHAVRALLERSADRVQHVFVIDHRDDARVREIANLGARHGKTVKRLAPAQFAQLFGDATHQGVYAEVRPLEPWDEAKLLDALGTAETALVLALDGVQDPHNLGACLRTADACGALAVVVPKDRAAQLNATVRKVAAGAAETTPLVTVTNLARTLKLLKEAGLWIAGAAAEAPKYAHETDLSGPIALVMGAEGTGLRQLTRQTCDFLVRLPQLGAVESLNVSVATGMLLYEAVRQRSKGTKIP